jgi:phosphoglycolate phosphatase-like HAD superfamily hydrolase
VRASAIRGGSALELGSRPIVDFDGTMAWLDVDWSGLRGRLGVRKIRDVWEAEGASDGVSGPWAEILAAERAAAETAQAVAQVVDALVSVEAFAVLSNNGESAVRIFCDRYPALRSRLRTVVGREALRGPKSDFACFGRGFAACLEALYSTGSSEGTGVVYAGDQAYELEFAARLGARTIEVASSTRHGQSAATRTDYSRRLSDSGHELPD